MTLTPTSSMSSISVLTTSTLPLQPSASLSSRQTQRYLLQRVKDLENEVEQKRVQLFASEEARAEVEARIDGLSTPTTPSDTTECPHLEYSDEVDHSESLTGHDRTTTAREVEYAHEILHLREQYQNLLTSIKLKLPIPLQATLKRKADKLHAEYETKLAAKDLERNIIAEELETCKAELELTRKEHETERRQARELHEVEHWAEVAEYETMLDKVEGYEKVINAHDEELVAAKAKRAEMVENYEIKLAQLRKERVELREKVQDHEAQLKKAVAEKQSEYLAKERTHGFFGGYTDALLENLTTVTEVVDAIKANAGILKRFSVEALEGVGE